MMLIRYQIFIICKLLYSIVFYSSFFFFVCVITGIAKLKQNHYTSIFNSMKIITRKKKLYIIDIFNNRKQYETIILFFTIGLLLIYFFFNL